jgi:hypothetical protein
LIFEEPAAASLDPRFRGGDNLQTSLPPEPLAERAPERLLANGAKMR